MGKCTATVIVLMVLMGAVMAFLWFGAGKYPRLKGKDFYVPALDRSSSVPSNNTIVLVVEVFNRNILSGIYYDAGVNLSLYFGPGLVGQASIPAFYQLSRKRVLKQAVLYGNGRAWEAALQEAVEGPVGFEMVLRMRIRYKGALWKRRTYHAQYDGYVLVGRDGRGRW
ncbi:hypothetical protein EJ110_NYTH35870 [Nymphaea thermarum]|nr:hypothetical protein EJ110_NYTH35870 [Nymphaea thermarum]